MGQAGNGSETGSSPLFSIWILALAVIGAGVIRIMLRITAAGLAVGILVAPVVGRAVWPSPPLDTLRTLLPRTASRDIFPALGNVVNDLIAVDLHIDAMYILVHSGPPVAERIALITIGADAIGKGLAAIDTA